MVPKSTPTVILSGFADEAAITKSVVEELAVMAALGLRYYSPRFVDLGNGVKNVMKLDDQELGQLVQKHQDYDIKVATIGSPIGKVKLVDVEDGTKNAYIPFERYLREDVTRAIGLAHRLGTRLLRGFSFYPPKGADHEQYFPQTIDQLGAIAERCGKEGVVFGLEIEANLMGSTGESMARLWREVHHPAMVTIFDGANLSAQNIPAEECLRSFRLMLEGMGWMHVKDYRIDPALEWKGHVDEERLKNFVPADVGDSGHAAIFSELERHLPTLTERMKALGAPGFFVELEPHLKGGGQFGGFSGPDGMGIALRALLRLLDGAKIGYELRDHAGLRK